MKMCKDVVVELFWYLSDTLIAIKLQVHIRLTESHVSV